MRIALSYRWPAMVLGALLIEAALWFLPYFVQYTESKFQWVDDQGPSFLIAILLMQAGPFFFYFLPVAAIFLLVLARYSRSPEPQ